MTQQSDAASKQADNHANQLNPNNDRYWQARGYTSRPSDWQAKDPKASPPSPTPPRR